MRIAAGRKRRSYVGAGFGGWFKLKGVLKTRKSQIATEGEQGDQQKAKTTQAALKRIIIEYTISRGAEIKTTFISANNN